MQIAVSVFFSIVAHQSSKCSINPTQHTTSFPGMLCPQAGRDLTALQIGRIVETECVPAEAVLGESKIVEEKKRSFRINWI
jgi:hypothetical protein